MRGTKIYYVGEVKEDVEIYEEVQEIRTIRNATIDVPKQMETRKKRTRADKKNTDN